MWVSYFERNYDGLQSEILNGPKKEKIDCTEATLMGKKSN